MSAHPFGRRSTSLASCVLRPVATGDVATICAAVAAIDPWRRLGFTAGALSLYLSNRDPGLVRRVVVVDGDAVGLACVRFPWLRGPYLELLAVLPACQGRGLGAEVLAWMEDSVRGRAANAWVAVSAFNENARRFYGRLGYRQVAVLGGLVKEGEAELLLRKTLGA